MFGLPMEIVGPVLGIGAIIAFIVAGVLVVHRFAPESRHPGLEGEERRRLDDLEARLGELEELKRRVGELEERVDFSERLLTRPPE